VRENINMPAWRIHYPIQSYSVSWVRTVFVGFVVEIHIVGISGSIWNDHYTKFAGSGAIDVTFPNISPILFF
jgi:hypothetical protein